MGTIKLGSIEIEVSQLVQIAIIIVLTFIITRIVKLLINRFIGKSSKLMKIDPTRYRFFRNALNAIIYIIATIAIIHTIPALRSISVTLLAGAGIFAAVLGFASQQAFSNIISGIFVVIFRPFRVGDIIRIGPETSTYFGTVEDITLRHTVIRDFENRRIVIPNSVINNETIINNDIVDQRVRRIMNFPVSYESNIDKAIAIIREEAMRHHFFVDCRTNQEIKNNEPPVLIRVTSLGEYSVNIRAYVWAMNFDNAFDMHCEMNQIILARFKKEGIEIPYPHRTVVYKKDIV